MGGLFWLFHINVIPLQKINMDAKLLDWVALMDFQHYINDDGETHWYLKGSLQRYTTEELISIYDGSASSELRESWLWATADAISKKKNNF